MALPHFRNLVSTNTRWEPIYKNLFEITVDLPALVRTPGSASILLENATSIDLNTTIKNLGEDTQRFKYSTRAFLKTPDDTSAEFDITFNINQNDKRTIENWIHLKNWYDLIWNSQTGELHYKNDYIGQISANIHDRTGIVIRRVDFVNCIITQISGFNMTWDNTGIIKSVTASFVADYYNDVYRDIE